MEPQVIELFLAELEHEISRKAVNIPFDCSNKNAGFNPVKRRNPSPRLCEADFGQQKQSQYG